MQRRAMLLPLVATMITGACHRKLELLPVGAKNITRSDSSEEIHSEDGVHRVKLREYRFVMPGGKAGQDFVCESREFSDAAAAMKAAQKSIAERPEEELKSERAHFALSGRSLWLRVDSNLLWCMYAGPAALNFPSPFSALKDSFIAKFREAS